MSPKLSQRIVDSFKEQIREQTIVIKNGLTTNSTEKAKEIGDRFLIVCTHMGSSLSEMMVRAASKTTVPEERQFLKSLGENNTELVDGSSIEEVADPVPKFAVLYDKQTSGSIDSELIPGSIVPFMCANLAGLILWYEFVDGLKKNPLFAKVAPIAATWTSNNQLEKFKAIIDRIDNQITPEVEDKLKEIIGISLSYEKQLYEFLYTGKDG